MLPGVTPRTTANRGGAGRVIIGVTAMTAGIDVIERVRNQAFVRQGFVHRRAIPAVTFRTDVFLGMDRVPFTLLVNRIFLVVTGDAG